MRGLLPGALVDPVGAAALRAAVARRGVVAHPEAEVLRPGRWAVDPEPVAVDPDADVVKLRAEDVPAVVGAAHPALHHGPGGGEARGDVLARRGPVVADGGQTAGEVAAVREARGADHPVGPALGGPVETAVLAQRRETALGALLIDEA